MRASTYSTISMNTKSFLTEQEVVQSRIEPDPPAALLVDRPRLLERMREDSTRTLMLLAPSGFGKSVLLGQFAQSESRDVQTVLVGAEHNDPTVLARSIADSKYAGEAKMHRELLESLRAPHPDIVKTVIPRLLATLQSRPAEFVLVLDELEHLTSLESLEIVAALCASMPRGSQLAIAGRADPPLPIGLMRARRQITEVRQEQLSMTKRECAQLLGAQGVQITGDQLNAIVRKTDGWAAAMYLAGLAIGESSNKARAVTQFAGDDRAIVDFLREQFLNTMPVAGLERVRRLSVLDRMCGQLCDAVTECSDSAAMLRELAGSNLLLSSLDRKGEWFRFHPLLRDVLRSELRMAEPDAEFELHARASRWWEAEGDIDRAIDHAISAGDQRRAGGLVWMAVPSNVSRGKLATVANWLDRNGDAANAEDAGLALSRAAIAVTTGRGAEGDHWMALARALLESEPESERKPALLGGVLLMDAMLARDGLTTIREQVALAESQLPIEDPWRSVCALLDGVARFLQDEPEPASERLREGVRRGSIAAPNVQILCHAQLAVQHLDHGDLRMAEGELTKARVQVERCGLQEYPMTAMFCATSALVYAKTGKTDLAKKDLLNAQLLVARLDNYAAWYEAQTRILLARAAHRLDCRSDSRALLEGATPFVNDVTDAPRLQRMYADAEVEILASRMPSEVGLTPAELRVLQQLNTHLSLPGIADATFVSTNTVKSHVRNIYKKLDAGSRAEAVDRAKGFGLLD